MSRFWGTILTVALGKYVIAGQWEMAKQSLSAFFSLLCLWHNPKHVCSEVSPIWFRGAYSQESAVRIVAFMFFF